MTCKLYTLNPLREAGVSLTDYFHLAVILDRGLSSTLACDGGRGTVCRDRSHDSLFAASSCRLLEDRKACSTIQIW